MRETNPPLPTCEEADLIRDTAIFTGNPTRSEGAELNAHALHCDRDDWQHALLHPSVWTGVKRERES